VIEKKIRSYLVTLLHDSYMKFNLLQSIDFMTIFLKNNIAIWIMFNKFTIDVAVHLNLIDLTLVIVVDITLFLVK